MHIAMAGQSSRPNEREGQKNFGEKGEGSLTRASLYRMDVVLGDIILDPGPVRVAVPLGQGVGVQHLGQGAVAEQARGQGNLEAEPVPGLSNVQDVPGGPPRR